MKILETCQESHYLNQQKCILSCCNISLTNSWQTKYYVQRQDVCGLCKGNGMFIRRKKLKKMKISSRITRGQGVLQPWLWFTHYSLCSLASHSPSLSLKNTSQSKWFYAPVSDIVILLCKFRNLCVPLEILKANLKCPTVLILCVTVTLSSSAEIQGNLS